MRKKPPASFEIKPHCRKSAGRLFGHAIPRRITILGTRFFRQIAIEDLRKRLVNRTALWRGKQRVKGFYARRPWSSRCIERNKQRGEGLTIRASRLASFVCAGSKRARFTVQSFDSAIPRWRRSSSEDSPKILPLLISCDRIIFRSNYVAWEMRKTEKAQNSFKRLNFEKKLSQNRFASSSR